MVARAAPPFAFRAHIACASAIIDRTARARTTEPTSGEKLLRARDIIAGWAGELAAPGLVRCSLDAYHPHHHGPESLCKRQFRELKLLVDSDVAIFFKKDRAGPAASVYQNAWQTAGELCLARVQLSLDSEPAEVYPGAPIHVRYKHIDDIPRALAAAQNRIIPAALATRDLLTPLRKDARALRYDLAVFLHRVTHGISLDHACARCPGFTPMKLVAVERIPELALRLSVPQIASLRHGIGVPLIQQLHPKSISLPNWERWGLDKALDHLCSPLIDLHRYLVERDGEHCVNPRFLADRDILDAVPTIRTIAARRPDFFTQDGFSWRRFLAEALRREPRWVDSF